MFGLDGSVWLQVFLIAFGSIAIVVIIRLFCLFVLHIDISPTPQEMEQNRIEADKERAESKARGEKIKAEGRIDGSACLTCAHRGQCNKFCSGYTPRPRIEMDKKDRRK